MLNMTVRNTRKLIREKSASENVRLGRFFTKRDTAASMAEFFTFEETKPCLTILDPGAGTGILSAALLEAVCRGRAATLVRLICYENNAVYLPMLKNNLERLRRRCRREYSVKVVYEVREENFLLSGQDGEAREQFDCVIMNPPDELCQKDSPEALSAKDLLSTPTVSLAYLFTAAALLRLAEDGQAVFLLPSAFATGVSLLRLRQSMIAECRVTAMHLFTSEKGLKKRFVLALRRTEEPGGEVRMLSSSDDGSPENRVLLPKIPYDRLVRPDGSGLLLLGDAEDLRVLNLLAGFPRRMSDFGLKMKTGLTLPSRYPDLLRDEPGRGVVPLIHPRALSGGRVLWPLRAPAQYLHPSIPSLIQNNRNLLLIRRFPAKSDPRRLMCGIWMASQAGGYRYISTHNKLNYIDREGEEMDAAFLSGLYALLSTSLYDRYVRIVSRSGQINATEFSDLPLPDADTITAIGGKLIAMRRYEPEICDITVSAQLRHRKN